MALAPVVPQNSMLSLLAVTPHGVGIAEDAVLGVPFGLQEALQLDDRLHEQRPPILAHPFHHHLAIYQGMLAGEEATVPGEDMRLLSEKKWLAVQFNQLPEDLHTDAQVAAAHVLALRALRKKQKRDPEIPRLGLAIGLRTAKDIVGEGRNILEVQRPDGPLSLTPILALLKRLSLAWETTARDYERMADRHLKEGHSLTAAQLFYLSALIVGDQWQTRWSDRTRPGSMASEKGRRAADSGDAARSRRLDKAADALAQVSTSGLEDLKEELEILRVEAARQAPLEEDIWRLAKLQAQLGRAQFLKMTFEEGEDSRLISALFYLDAAANALTANTQISDSDKVKAARRFLQSGLEVLGLVNDS